MRLTSFKGRIRLPNVIATLCGISDIGASLSERIPLCYVSNHHRPGSVLRRRWLRDASALPPAGSVMSQHQIKRFAALVREIDDAKAKHARSQVEIDAGIAKAKQQLADARALLARLNAILHSNVKQT